ncbi:MAG TPA: 50S ribosomal protein L6 [Bacilli bacterium]|nr:50S ribosomal protein L6 [Bacilli bacterium]
MSRVGNKAIKLIDTVSVEIKPGNFVVVKGPKGEVSQQLCPKMDIKVEENSIKITRPSDSQEHRTLHGTTRALLNNMVEGVTNGFLKRLEIQGTGYRASLKENVLVVAAGYSHLVEMVIPEGLTVEVPALTEVVVMGMDKQAVGQFAAEVRAIRKPEPYLGKGIRYKGEIVRRKEGKKAK